ncbi:MAG: hypothetical protein ACI8QZ_003501 [Chlamydiales bacterium]|jgi:hypothetical protein
MLTSPRSTARPSRKRSGHGHALGLSLLVLAGLGLLYAGFRIGRSSKDAAAEDRALAVAPDPRPKDEGQSTVPDPRDTRVHVPREIVTPAPVAAREIAQDPNASPEPRGNPGLNPGHDPQERMARLRQLRRGEDPAARLALAREILAEDSTDPLTVHALQTLAELDPSSAADEIRRRLAKTTDDPRGRGTMAMVIGMLASNEQALTTADLASFYEQGDRSVQLAAAQALRTRGDETLSMRLNEQCKLDLTSEDAQVRSEALRQLASTRTEGNQSLIIPLLADPDEQVRMQALRSLSQASSTADVLDHVRGLIDDPSLQVQRSAQRILQNMQRRNELRQR